MRGNDELAMSGLVFGSWDLVGGGGGGGEAGLAAEGDVGADAFLRLRRRSERLVSGLREEA